MSQFADDLHLTGSTTFVKIEAEGFEPEILRGFGSFRPAILSIDVSPERDSNSTLSEVQIILGAMGYKSIKNTLNNNVPSVLLTVQEGY